MLKLPLPISSDSTSPLREAAVFLVLTFVLSWLFWIPGALIQAAIHSVLGDALVALGSFAPLAVALYLSFALRQDNFPWRRWFQTLTLRAVLVALFLPVCLLAPVIMYRLFLGTFDLGRLLGDMGGALLPIIGSLLIAAGEEGGWRGYLLPRLSAFPIFAANLAIGVLWFLWQLPLLLSLRNVLGLAAVTPLALLIFSILTTPFFNRLAIRGQGNLLLPILMRASLGVTLGIYLLQPTSDYVAGPYGMLTLLWLFLLNLILFSQLWRGRRAPDDESELERVMPLESA